MIRVEDAGKDRNKIEMSGTSEQLMSEIVHVVKAGVTLKGFPKSLYISILRKELDELEKENKAEEDEMPCLDLEKMLKESDKILEELLCSEDEESTPGVSISVTEETEQQMKEKE